MGDKRISLRYFDGLIDRLWSKFNGWKCDLLSLAAYKVLFQSVLTVMLRFMIVNYWVSKTTIDNFNKEFRPFLWGKSNGAHGMPFVTWKRICRSHKEDGFDI